MFDMLLMLTQLPTTRNTIQWLAILYFFFSHFQVTMQEWRNAALRNEDPSKQQI